MNIQIRLHMRTEEQQLLGSVNIDTKVTHRGHVTD